MDTRPIREQVFTIQQMAQLTELTAHTLRYYERAGLMQYPVRRADTNGYREYTQQDAAWITFLKRLRATGMPIRDIQRYIDLLRQGEQTLAERMQILKHHRTRVEAQLRAIEDHLAAITAKITYYEQQSVPHPSVPCAERQRPHEDT